MRDESEYSGMAWFHLAWATLRARPGVSFSARSFLGSAPCLDCYLSSVSADGFQAPGVVMNRTDDAGLRTGKAFHGEGLQTAAGVSLMVDKPADFRSFRIGLQGRDKVRHIDCTVANLDAALDAILDTAAARAVA